MPSPTPDITPPRKTVGGFICDLIAAALGLTAPTTLKENHV